MRDSSVDMVRRWAAWSRGLRSEPVGPAGRGGEGGLFSKAEQERGLTPKRRIHEEWRGRADWWWGFCLPKLLLLPTELLRDGIEEAKAFGRDL